MIQLMLQTILLSIISYLILAIFQQILYKFVSPGCNACYIGKTTRHLSTRIKEYLETHKKPHIFAHIVNNETCKALSTEN